jgi:predicted Rossmann-fold nucleotide-binding protein
VKIAIVGSRDGVYLDSVIAHVEAMHRRYPEAIVVSGGAKGVDRVAENSARRLGHWVLSFRPIMVNARFCIQRVSLVPESFEVADVEYLGEYEDFRDAAFARNTMIVKEADVVVAFTVGSPGTAHSISEARRLSKKLVVYDADGRRWAA